MTDWTRFGQNRRDRNHRGSDSISSETKHVGTGIDAAALVELLRPDRPTAQIFEDEEENRQSHSGKYVTQWLGLPSTSIHYIPDDDHVGKWRRGERCDLMPERGDMSHLSSVLSLFSGKRGLNDAPELRTLR